MMFVTTKGDPTFLQAVMSDGKSVFFKSEKMRQKEPEKCKCGKADKYTTSSR